MTKAISMRTVLFLYNDEDKDDVKEKIIEKLNADKYFTDKYTIIEYEQIRDSFSFLKDFVANSIHNVVVLLIGDKRLQPDVSGLTRQLSSKLPFFIVAIIRGNGESVPFSLQRSEYIDFSKDEDAIKQLKDQIYGESRGIYV